MNKKRRVKIPEAVADSVLLASQLQCCVCRQGKVVLHHVNEDPSDNRPENLAVLCHIHHEEAHTPNAHSRRLTAAIILRAKSKWEAEVAKSKRDRIALDSGCAFSPRHWDYFNFRHLIELCTQSDIDPTQDDAYAHLRAQSVLHSDAMPQIPTIPQSNRAGRSIYDTFSYTNGHLLHQLFSRLVDRFATLRQPDQIDLSYPKPIAKRCLVPSRVVFMSRRFDFRVVSSAGEPERRRARAKANGISVLFEFDTALLFSNSGRTLHFVGGSVIGVILLVRSAGPDEAHARQWVVKATPIAIGVGFPRLSPDKPSIAYQKEVEQDPPEDGADQELGCDPFSD